MKTRGIDISSWQGNLTIADFKKIKDSGYEFVMIRCGYTGYGLSKKKNIDRYFENNYALCKQVGLDVGTYYYSCATTVMEGLEEANFILNLIKNKKFEYPIAIDTEDNHNIKDKNNYPVSQASIGRQALTPIINFMCAKLEESGYYASIYASTYWFKNNLILNDLSKYDKWVASWSNDAPTGLKYGMWQYSSKGIVLGINGKVDLDYSFKNFPIIMKEFGLNNYEKENIKPTPEPNPIPSNPKDEEKKPNWFIKLLITIFQFLKKLFKRGV